MIIWGDTGFLGQNLVLSMKDNYDEILGISSDSVRIYKGDHIEEIYLDALKKKNVNTAIFAASMRYNPTLYRKDPISVYSKNMEALSNFINFLSNNTIKEVILLSSHVVYGQSEGINDELSDVTLKSLSKSEFYYGSAKIHQEELLQEFCLHHSINFSVLRIPSLYGPYSTLNLNQAHVIPTFIMRLLQESSCKIQAYGTGNELRDFLFVDDLVRIIRQIIDSPSGVMNIAPQSFITIKELGDELLNVLSIDKKICFSNDGAVSNSTYRKVSSAKFEKRLPDFSYTSLNIGLKATVNYYREKL